MSDKKAWLRLSTLSSEYERRARLLPALASLLPLMPLTFALGGSYGAWGKLFTGTAGVFVVGGLALAAIASAYGNRLQKKLWPDWPFDAPTNKRLMPDSKDTSPQQRIRWYKQIKALTGLNLYFEGEDANETVVRATINDAVERLRNRYKRGKSQVRHEQESIRYGYARNLAGLWPVWVGLAMVSCLGCWAIYLWAEGGVIWVSISTVTVVAVVLVKRLLPSYVQIRAKYYCEVFFQLLEEEALAAGWSDEV